MKSKNHSLIPFKPVSIIWGILLCTLSYSFVTQTILSVFKRGQVLCGITGSIGFLILLGGVALFAYSGYIFWIHTALLFGNNSALLTNIGIIRNPEADRETKRAAQKENLQFLIKTWKPILIYFLLAFLLIVGGAILVNISDGTIYLGNQFAPYLMCGA